MPGHPLRRALGTWWRDRSVGFRRIVRTLVLLLASTLVCLGAGAVTATASSPVGPHQARWSTTLDSTLTVDLGPLGSASLDSPAGPLGVRVLLGEIPSDAATPGTDDLAALLTGDLGSYSSLAAHPDLTVRQGLRALRDDALRRATFEATDAAFGQRRKTLRAALKDWAGGAAASEALLAEAGIDPARRGETLTIDEFTRLGAALIRLRASGAVAERPDPRTAGAANA